MKQDKTINQWKKIFSLSWSKLTMAGILFVIVVFLSGCGFDMVKQKPRTTVTVSSILTRTANYI